MDDVDFSGMKSKNPLITGEEVSVRKVDRVQLAPEEKLDGNEIEAMLKVNEENLRIGPALIKMMKNVVRINHGVEEKLATCRRHVLDASNGPAIVKAVEEILRGKKRVA